MNAYKEKPSTMLQRTNVQCIVMQYVQLSFTNLLNIQRRNSIKFQVLSFQHCYHRRMQVDYIFKFKVRALHNDIVYYKSFMIYKKGFYYSFDFFNISRAYGLPVRTISPDASRIYKDFVGCSLIQIYKKMCEFLFLKKKNQSVLPCNRMHFDCICGI